MLCSVTSVLEVEIVTVSPVTWLTCFDVLLSWTITGLTDSLIVSLTYTIWGCWSGDTETITVLT